MLETIEIRKKDVSPEEWEKTLKGLERGNEYRITTDGSWIEWCGEFIDTLVMGGDFIEAIRKAKKTPFPGNDDLANAFRSVGKSMCRNGLNVSENKETKEPQDKTEQAHRQTGDKPPQYQIGIDTFERMKANCNYEEIKQITDNPDVIAAFEPISDKDKAWFKEMDKVAEDAVEQAHRQTGDKPPQYQIGIDTFERSKANQMAETRVEIAKFMIDKYNWRNKGQDIEDFKKIKDYCDFAIEALNEMEGKNV